MGMSSGYPGRLYIIWHGRSPARSCGSWLVRSMSPTVGTWLPLNQSSGAHADTIDDVDREPLPEILTWL
jgi:hypothetical protein